MSAYLCSRCGKDHNQCNCGTPLPNTTSFESQTKQPIQAPISHEIDMGVEYTPHEILKSKELKTRSPRISPPNM